MPAIRNATAHGFTDYLPLTVNRGFQSAMADSDADLPGSAADRMSYASSSARISLHNERHSMQIAAGPANVSPDPAGIVARAVT